MSEPVTLQQLAGVLASQSGQRHIIALAGAPGSGKSTIAAELAAMLNAANPHSAAILPMDGFHYDDALLMELGRKARKGAPDTFDVAGFRHILQRLKQNAETSVAVPVFDRDLEISRGGARLISSGIPVIIVEGNYLLLTQGEWSTLGPLFDCSVYIDASQDVLRKRLTQRWQGYGLPEDEIRRRVEGNDLPNGAFVAAHSSDAQYRLSTN